MHGLGMVALAAVTGGCGGDTPREPKASPVVTATPVPAPTPTSRPTRIPRAVTVTTNEPFYAAVIDGDAIRLSGVDVPERSIAIVARERVAGGMRWRGKDVVVTVTAEPCADDMSGEPRPFRGTLDIGGYKVRGCGFPTPASTPTPATTLAVTIPARFLGRWDRDAAACAAPATSIEGVTISPRELRFHESVGEVTAVASDGAAVRITARYSGEGENWTTRQSLTLDGKRITIMGEGAPIRRVRCAG